mmetsp:Transcript_14282/g.23490  ORF Transcript_14282/g.23490 Transcript_14282/m.23490 type:complete len:245 (-) Transcript_14282:224-958(-)
METAEAMEALDVSSGEGDEPDEDEELMYGEFDMGFFLALLDSLEGDLTALEKARSGAGVFVDVGSGRGQLAVLAAAARPWARCVGLEYMPVLHSIADCVAGVSTDAVTSEPPSREEVAAALPHALTPSPLAFYRGDMYDAEVMAEALEGATLVFMFSTRFGVDEGGGEDVVGDDGGDREWGVGEGEGTLKVSSHLRQHIAAGTVVVTVNNVMRATDGFELRRRATGRDTERTMGSSTAYVWMAV